MKRLEISKLMDEYQDNEFFPEGGSTADTQAVKDRVLARADTEKRRRTPPLKTVLLAAALAVGCLLSIAAAAGLPMTAYQLLTGGAMLADVNMSGPNPHVYINLDHAFPEDPLVLENGRLWLVLNGKHTDITDRIDAETPYVINATDPESGLKSSLIVGGTPEDFGWCLWAEAPNGGGFGGIGENYKNTYVVIDGVACEWTEELDSQCDSWEIRYKPWYKTGYFLETARFLFPVE